MKSETLGIIIGGVVPALCFTVTNLSIKLSNQQGIGAGYYIIMLGLGVLLTGVALWLVWPDKTFTSGGAIFSFASGVTWAFGAAAVAFALTKYGTPLGQLTPLFNMNTLFTVLLALWIFAEWKQVKIPQLLVGSVLIVIGGTMVAKA